MTGLDGSSNSNFFKINEMIFRAATPDDIEGMSAVRLAVSENRLSDPSKVSRDDYHAMLTQHGHGWVCETGGQIVGFAIVDLTEKNVWALFLLPAFERQGIGKKLHDLMTGWVFAQGIDRLWLSTAAGTRAEGFYRKMGWQDAGFQPNGEVRFEMSLRANP
jgi:GNAT superfamily N-acetyltransferase